MSVPIPRWVTLFNKRYFNKGMRRLVGFGPLGEIEHVGRSSGRVYRTVVTAFRRQDSVVIALFYGSEVDWLQNLTAAGGGWLRLGKERLRISAPRPMSTSAGKARMPAIARTMLPLLRVDQFVESSVLR